MTQSSSSQKVAKDQPSSRQVQRLPSGYRVLQVNVPQRLFDMAKAKALMTGTPWPEFVVKLLTEATADLAKAMPDASR
jgi:hypothetical protein